MMTPKPYVLAFMVALLAMAACDRPSTLPPLSAEQQRAAIKDAAVGPQRLQPGDKIKITVFGEDRLSGEYTIDPSGAVSLPLAGTVKAAGSTKAQLEKSLARKFRGDYLRNPKVTVEIAAYRPIYLLGEVEKPGEYPFKPGLNALTAAALAGGLTYRASKTRVLIRRADEGGFREYSTSDVVPVLPGDLIRVPQRYF